MHETIVVSLATLGAVLTESYIRVKHVHPARLLPEPYKKGVSTAERQREFQQQPVAAAIPLAALLYRSRPFAVCEGAACSGDTDEGRMSSRDHRASGGRDDDDDDDDRSYDSDESDRSHDSAGSDGDNKEGKKEKKKLKDPQAVDENGKLEVVNRRWEERAAALMRVRMKLRVSWRNDEKVLNMYFEACANNWKLYKGEKKPKMVLKLHSFYKQAMQGDCDTLPPENMKSLDYLKWDAWHSLKGMPQVMAKRRFITYLAEIDPLIIDVMPDEKPPPGFPLDREGRQICAKVDITLLHTRYIF